MSLENEISERGIDLSLRTDPKNSECKLGAVWMEETLEQMDHALSDYKVAYKGKCDTNGLEVCNKKHLQLRQGSTKYTALRPGKIHVEYSMHLVCNIQDRYILKISFHPKTCLTSKEKDKRECCIKY